MGGTIYLSGGKTCSPNIYSTGATISGKIGIGTTNPGDALDINKTLAEGGPFVDFRYNSGANTYYGGVRWMSGTGVKGWAIENNTTVGNDYLEFNKGSSAKMVQSKRQRRHRHDIAGPKAARGGPVRDRRHRDPRPETRLGRGPGGCHCGLKGRGPGAFPG